MSALHLSEISNWNSSPGVYITNSLFDSNISGQGGGIYSYDALTTIDNSTIFYNYSNYSQGGGICNKYYATTYVNNSILWGNSSPVGEEEIYNYDMGTAYITYSDVYMDSPSSVWIHLLLCRFEYRAYPQK